MASSLLVFFTALCFMMQLEGAPDNRGREFVIGYMENIAENMDVELFVTTMRTTVVSVSATAPRYTSASINHQFTVTAGVVKQLSFSPKIRMSGSSFSSKGVLITATDEIVIYGVNKEEYSCDAFLGLPTDVLGKEYYSITYYPPSRQCELLVVGVEDGTSVKITIGSAIGSKYVSYQGKKYRKGKTLTVAMNRFDTLQLVSEGDLSGTYIESTKPVSVFSGNKKTNIGRGWSSDHLVEHLTPVATWGKKFVTVPLPLRTTGDYWRFISSESNTRITISGGYSTSFTLNAGQMVQKTIASGKYCLIQSDKPILVVQFCLSQQSSREKSDPMMMIIPPVEQFGADYTFATPKYSLGSYNNYFMFIVKESEKSGLRLDGNTFPSNTKYNKISGTDYVGGYVAVSEGSHTVRHISPISIFGGYLYGQANYETYGFTTGMRMAAINTICMPTTTEVGDGIDNDCDGMIDEELCTLENKGKDDDGDGRVEEDCATPSPIDGKWGGWGSWTTCSIPCIPATGGSTSGTKTRTRACNNPAPEYDGKQCAGGSSLTTSCSPSSHCPVHGNWGGWGGWGGCSVTCASGVQSRTRTCNNPAPQHGGNGCSGNGTSTKSCTENSCPIDGAWASWGSWGSCTVSCGGGTKQRSRSCTNPAPQYNGTNCAGSNVSSTSCNANNCPIDGAWTSWGSWGSCTVSCGGGTKQRSRSCTNPAPQYNGTNCAGSGFSSTFCNTNNCPIDGAWTSWGSWGSCTFSCGGGTKQRSRSCTNPAPQYNGTNCAGSNVSSTSCNANNCPIDGAWASWGSWGSCTVSCGGGTKQRSRYCTNPAPQYNGTNCAGSNVSSTICNANNCPIDGGFTPWSSWSICTVTCGGGTAAQGRSCTNPSPKYGGASCTGITTRQKDCNTHVCIIDGAWTTWSTWSSCSATCGGGKRSRIRSCDDPLPANGGLPCSGNSGEIQDCNTNSCPVPKSGVYQQRCPVGWFSCNSGAINCIVSEFRCDCDKDCEDGSDEDGTYAGCGGSLLANCRNGAYGLAMFQSSALLLLCSAVYILLLTVCKTVTQPKD